MHNMSINWIVVIGLVSEFDFAISSMQIIEKAVYMVAESTKEDYFVDITIAKVEGHGLVVRASQYDYEEDSSGKRRHDIEIVVEEYLTSEI